MNDSSSIQNNTGLPFIATLRTHVYTIPTLLYLIRQRVNLISMHSWVDIAQYSSPGAGSKTYKGTSSLSHKAITLPPS